MKGKRKVSYMIYISLAKGSIPFPLLVTMSPFNANVHNPCGIEKYKDI